MQANFRGASTPEPSMAGVVDLLTGDTMRTVVIAEVGLGLLSSTLAADPSVALGLFGLVAIIQVIQIGLHRQVVLCIRVEFPRLHAACSLLTARQCQGGCQVICRSWMTSTLRYWCLRRAIRS